MAFAIEEKYQTIIHKIMANLPTSQFIVDLVGGAIKVAGEKYPDEFETRLDIALRMSEYAKEVSQPLYYKAHLVIAPLVAGLEASEINKLETASGTLSKACAPLGVFVTAKTFKQKWKALFELSKVDVDVLGTALMFAKVAVDKAFKEKDLYTLAGYAYIEVNIRQSGMFINHTVRKYYNEFASVVLNQAEF